MSASAPPSFLPDVVEWSCTGQRRGWQEEAPERALIELPFTGMDLRRVRGRQVVASVGSALLHAANEGYALASPTDRPRQATCLLLGPELVEELAPGFRSVAVRTSARTALLQWRLRQTPQESLDRDELALALVDGVWTDVRSQAVAADQTSPALAPRQRGGVSPAWARLAAALDERLAAGYDQALRLEPLARDCGASPHHASRVYREVTGTSLHRQLNRLRLREALFRLPDMRGQLTELALSLGFSSHSHFSSAFRAEFGRPPTSLGRAR